MQRWNCGAGARGVAARKWVSFWVDFWPETLQHPRKPYRSENERPGGRGAAGRGAGGARDRRARRRAARRPHRPPLPAPPRPSIRVCPPRPSLRALVGRGRGRGRRSPPPCPRRGAAAVPAAGRETKLTAYSGDPGRRGGGRGPAGRPLQRRAPRPPGRPCPGAAPSHPRPPAHVAALEAEARLACGAVGRGGVGGRGRGRSAWWATPPVAAWPPPAAACPPSQPAAAPASAQPPPQGCTPAPTRPPAPHPHPPPHTGAQRAEVLCSLGHVVAVQPDDHAAGLVGADCLGVLGFWGGERGTRVVVRVQAGRRRGTGPTRLSARLARALRRPCTPSPTPSPSQRGAHC
jgi:hypothetical protein